MLVMSLLPLGCGAEVVIERDAKLTRQDVLAASVTRASDGDYEVGAVGLADLVGFEAEPIGEAGPCRVTETFADPDADIEEAEPVDGAFIDVEIGTELHSFDLGVDHGYLYPFKSEEPLFAAGDPITFRVRGAGVPQLERTVTAIDIPAVVMPPIDDDGVLRLQRREGLSITWDPATDAGTIELEIRAAMEETTIGNTITTGPVWRTLLCEVDASDGALAVKGELFELMPEAHAASLSVTAGRQWIEEVDGWTVRFRVGGYATVVGYEDSVASYGIGPMWLE